MRTPAAIAEETSSVDCASLIWFNAVLAAGTMFPETSGPHPGIPATSARRRWTSSLSADDHAAARAGGAASARATEAASRVLVIYSVSREVAPAERRR